MELELKYADLEMYTQADETYCEIFFLFWQSFQPQNRVLSQQGLCQVWDRMY